MEAQMVDSSVVLYGQTIAYTLYCLAIILVMGWFAFRITRAGKGNPVKAGIFYAFVLFLAALGVSLHLITYNTIPWTKVDLNRDDYKPDKAFAITVENHQFRLPAERMVASAGNLVRFDVESKDLTYGFGLFRKDNSMVFQMQVVPGHRNDVLWRFEKPGIYTIRSTEYSGPKGTDMIVEDVFEVVGAGKPN
jgi:cytochrome c oxidase subunit II